MEVSAVQSMLADSLFTISICKTRMMRAETFETEALKKYSFIVGQRTGGLGDMLAARQEGEHL